MHPLGPITVLNKTIFNILQHQNDPPDYLHFIGWVYLWGAILHWITAALNCKSAASRSSIFTYSPSVGCNFLKYVTRFPCDTFGFFVSWVYLQYGVQVITRQFTSSSGGALDGAYVQLVLALVMLVLCFLFQRSARTTLFHRHVRRFLDDYGMPISLIAVSGLAYWGRFNSSNPDTLPISGAFQPAGGRAWLVRFWKLPGKWVGVAFPFGVVLWVLFFFDHNVSVRHTVHSGFPSGLKTSHIVLDCSGIGVPASQTTRVPLRLLPSRHHDLHRRAARPPCTKWPHPPSAYPHNLAARHGPQTQVRRRIQGYHRHGPSYGCRRC